MSKTDIDAGLEYAIQEATPSPLLMVQPEMLPSEYAKMVNQKPGIIVNHVNRGILPSVKRGKYRMVNVAKIFWDNANRI